jgi:hypothetical protein
MSVYVVQNPHRTDKRKGALTPKFDLSPAEKFGDLIYLLSPLQVPNDPREIIGELQEKLSKFSDEDYLLLIGNPCFIGWATAVAAATNNGRVRMLQYNGKRRRYYVIKCKDLI